MTSVPPVKTALSRELQCAYRSKFCDAPRATKLDGSLHKLCDFHRRKANANQQRLHRRKKRMLEEQGGGATSPRCKKPRASPDSPQSATEPIDGATFQGFDQLDVQILQVLLFDAESSSRELGGFSAMLATETVPLETYGDTWAVTL